MTVPRRCREPHPLEDVVLHAFTQQRAHDASSLVHHLPCYPHGTMKHHVHRRLFKQCYRAAREVLQHLECQQVLRRDHAGWWLLASDPYWLPEPKPPVEPEPSPPPPRGYGLRLVHSR